MTKSFKTTSKLLFKEDKIYACFFILIAILFIIWFFIGPFFSLNNFARLMILVWGFMFLMNGEFFLIRTIFKPIGLTHKKIERFKKKLSKKFKEDVEITLLKEPKNRRYLTILASICLSISATGILLILINTIIS